MVDIRLCVSDITDCDVDAIVCLADPKFVAKTGISAKIHKLAGPKMEEEIQKIKKKRFPNGMPVGEAIVTKGYNLNAKCAIHVICPKHEPTCDQGMLLFKCFKNTLRLAERRKVKSIAFPSISTGVYKYPKKECARTAKKVLEEFKFKSIEKVVLCMFKQSDYNMFQKVLGERD
jgi:O-acetyl-ADP-ribose deacetylase (regulator of RNase III)